METPKTAGRDPTVSVRHSRNTRWSMDAYHFHQPYEIYFSLSDGVQFFVSDTVYDVKRGDLFVFCPTDLHRSVAPPELEYERYVVYFDPAFLEGLSTPSTDLLELFKNRSPGFTHCVHLSPEKTDSLLALLETLSRHEREEGYGADVRRRIALAELLLLVNACFRQTGGRTQPSESPDFRRISPILQYIQRHLDEEITLQRLSEEFYLSKGYLCTLFRRGSGFSVNEYIVRSRILRAAELLREGLPVTRVCELSGFGSLSHFIRTFTRMMNRSPKQYAKYAAQGGAPASRELLPGD